jgi:uncharacterized protein
VTLHVWRMGILLLIGLFHQSLLWEGDILATYALLGLLLLAFQARPARDLERAAGVAFALPTLALAALTALAPGLAGGEGGRARLALSVVEFGYPVRQACYAFAMFLLGLAAGRDPGAGERAREALRRRLSLLLGLGVAGSLAAVTLASRSQASAVSWTAVAVEALVALSGPALALAYAGLLLRALERPGLRRALAPLAAAGRLSLTLYLLQSVLGVALLSRLGEVRPLAGIALTCLLFGLQVAASRAWLACFRFGPVEWLWRAATYGRLPPLRV